MSGYHKVKSLKSNNPLFVAFCNRTNRNVALVWHDYDGKLHWYVTFSPGCVHERRTFENHAWSAYDSDTLDKLLIGQTFVFNPTIPNQDTKQDICVERAYIDIPVYSLLERCLQTVKKYIPDGEIDNLRIPECLKEEIKKESDVPFFKHKPKKFFPCII